MSLIPHWIQDLATALSILGFGVTLYVLFEVRGIKKSFLSRARLPELIKDLETSGSALNGYLNEWPTQRNQAICQVKVAGSLIKSAAAMVPPVEKKELLKIHKKLSKAVGIAGRGINGEKELVWDVYSDIQSCITSITQISKNNRWG